MESNILVIGGTGKTGRRVVEQLTKKGIDLIWLFQELNQL